MYENCIVPLPRRARKPRPQTRGIMLDKMNKSLGGLRMRISVAERNRRPHDLVQVAKFALEAGVLVRHEIPILCIGNNTRGRGLTPSIVQNLWTG